MNFNICKIKLFDKIYFFAVPLCCFYLILIRLHQPTTLSPGFPTHVRGGSAMSDVSLL